MKLLLTITTGRPNVQRVVRALIANAERFGHQTSEIDLLINYDPRFLNIPPHDFSIDDASVDRFRCVRYIGPTEERRARSFLRRCGVAADGISLISQPGGYGLRKNLVLLAALLEGFDAVLFWDDDEYPLVSGGTLEHVRWWETDVFGAHRAALQGGADVAFGFWSGFVSPVTPDLREHLSNETARALGEALEIGTETFSASSFMEPGCGFVLVDGCPPCGEISASRGGKWVSGGNLALSSAAIRDGRVPPFYTPPGSRGDDTLLSLRLHAATVTRVPSGIFHDCFQDLANLCDGERPSRLELPRIVERHCLQRFADALDAWLAYAPLLLRLTQPDSCYARAAEMTAALQRVDAALPREFPDLHDRLREPKLARRFAFYWRCMPSCHADLEQLHLEWMALLGRTSRATAEFLGSEAA